MYKGSVMTTLPFLLSGYYWLLERQYSSQEYPFPPTQVVEP